MGAYVSIDECRSHYNKTVVCELNLTSTPPTMGGHEKGQVPPDPDIAGIGIVSVFIGVTAFALVLSSFDVLWLLAKTLGWKSRITEDERSARKQFSRRCDGISLSIIFETLVMSCSDQQIFTGGAYALTLRYWKGCEITAYHYNIVANMMLLTCATHLMSVTIVRDYWRYPWLAFLRILVVTGLFLITGLLLSNQNATKDLRFPTSLPGDNETDSTMFLPAACFQSENNLLATTLVESTSSAQQAANTFLRSEPGNHIQGWNLFLIILLWYCVAFIVDVARFLNRGKDKIRDDGTPGKRARLVRFFRGHKPKSLGVKIFKTLFCFYLLGGIAVSAATVYLSAHYMMALRSWVKRSAWLQLDEGYQSPEDDATSFGQLVPIFLCLLTLFSFTQTISEMSKRYSEKEYRKDGTIIFNPSPSTPSFMPDKKSPQFSEGPLSPFQPNQGWSGGQSPNLDRHTYASSTGISTHESFAQANNSRYPANVPFSSTGSPQPNQNLLSDTGYFPSQPPVMQHGQAPVA